MEVGSSRDWIDISSNKQGCGDAGPDIGWSPEVAMAWAPRHPCRRACTIDEGEKESRGSGVLHGWAFSLLRAENWLMASCCQDGGGEGSM